MVDETVPPADFPPTPRAPFTSPYGMYPDVDAARDELAAEIAARGNVVDPLAVPFDPTKPTIDQTRSNAIDSIRNNFAALNTVSTIDPTLYLKKTADVATDLTVQHPTAASKLTINPIAGQQGNIVWQQAAVLKYVVQQSNDTTTWSLQATNDSAVTFSAFAVRRADGMALMSGGLAIGGGNFPRTSAGAPVALDLYKSTQAATSVMQSNDGTTLRITAGGNANNYIDSLYCGATPTNVDPAVGQRPLNIRTQDASGAIQTRLIFDNSGAILAGKSAFAGTYTALSGSGPFALDFRVSQSYQVAPGATISGITMATGQVARIIVAGAGAITLPAGLHLQQGGAIWGTVYSIVSLMCVDGAGGFIFATFTPFQS